MAPGAELAGLVTVVTGPGGTVLGTLSDQEILGVLGAVQRPAAWAAWKTNESWARMLPVRARGHGRRPAPADPRRARAGVVPDYKVKIIAAQTAGLSDEHVAKADVLLAAAGQVKNPAGLRDFARRQVARLDPRAAARKNERALRNAYVRTWQEDSGNMSLAAREMPSADGLIAWQNIERRALDLRAAGMDRTSHPVPGCALRRAPGRRGCM